MIEIETKHELLNIREEINAERDQKIVDAKQDYLDEMSTARQTLKDTIKDIKTAYRQKYADKKVELIANEVIQGTKEGDE